MDYDDLTPAGQHLRDVAEGNPDMFSEGLPCAQEHTPGRVCILPDGHTDEVMPDHWHILGPLLERGSSYNALGRRSMPIKLDEFASLLMIITGQHEEALGQQTAWDLAVQVAGSDEMREIKAQVWRDAVEWFRGEDTKDWVLLKAAESNPWE